MLLLYHGGGSQEVQLVEQLNPVKWELVKRNAVRYLRLSLETPAADLLESTPFELWRGTNGFGDDFELLHANISIERYLDEVLSQSMQSEYYGGIADAMEQINNPLRFIAVDVALDDSEAVPTPLLKITSATVERALRDFETLVRSKGGAASGVDRIHTALHGYLEAVCDDACIQHNDGTDITALFNVVRQHHRKMQSHPPGVEAEQVLRGLARIIDALNPVRNRKSMAHPNDELLQEPEAMLVINAVRTVLHYLNAKLD
jgi:Abortive infection C-terminus